MEDAFIGFSNQIRLLIKRVRVWNLQISLKVKKKWGFCMLRNTNWHLIPLCVGLWRSFLGL